MNQNMIYDVSYMDALNVDSSNMLPFLAVLAAVNFGALWFAEKLFRRASWFRSYRRYGARQYIGC